MQTISMRQRINNHIHPKQLYKIKPLEEVNWMLPDLMTCLQSGDIDLVQDYLTVEAHVPMDELRDYIEAQMASKEGCDE